MGTPVIDSGLIGALPGYAAFCVVRDALKAGGIKPGQMLLENWGVIDSPDEIIPGR